MSSKNPVRFVRETAQDVRTVARGWRWGRRPLVPLSAQPFQPPKQPSVFPTAWARTPTANAVRDVVQRFGLHPLLSSTITPHSAGLDVLTTLKPPVLFVANHTSHLDTPLILCSLPDEWRRRTAVAAAADYFFDTWWRASGSAMVFNTFPIERRGGTLSTTPGDVLDQGWNVVVFPEGTRSVDGWATRFRLGAAWLAVEHGVPVVPIGIRGSYAAMPRGRGWPRPGRLPVRIRFGAPVWPAEGEAPRTFAPRIQQAVSRLLDEDATSWWDATRRAARGETPDPAGPQVASWRRIWAQTAPPAEGRKRGAWR
ncbi:1-acyl-sn-glycerol-3-phosphate acyltransferases [Actinopolymorpha cephalotaxi]|uniref:1-acyl-sn-glycerol-3-phosphate acyltransferase n=1 Tax=Actinopolymorpha cephalotaxi TaxID=504797 RepID=A0A1I2W780_9ACTN|nr:lysophospholipid acyltransferase family protein [Actinopolymorpha cephalotaxi]NYH82713.1 1-acyl-sn-glycerol-3-phosphate acyltransferase [Actinopolymorpha cephalotaxi]SFG97288.1 1-acyl-sn-glycerol-3-phosphate acyltransferases [Actinopolymorpha cephalotaxi]